jgi:hypothetical protein
MFKEVKEPGRILEEISPEAWSVLAAVQRTRGLSGVCFYLYATKALLTGAFQREKPH